MFGKIAFASLAAVGATLFTGASAQAAAYPGFCVEYRQCQWNEREFYNHGQAHTFADRKRHQGFEVAIDHHGNHVHVRYRMPLWHVYRTAFNRHEAHDLAHVLQARGFEARVH
jgi:hypothetical protein